MKKAICLLMCVAMVSTVMMAAPSGGVVWGTTVGQGVVLRQTADLINDSNTTTAPGLVVAMNHHLQKALNAIADLNAVDTITLSEEELNDYTAAITDLNLALRYVNDVATAKGITSVQTASGNALTSLINVVKQQSLKDGYFSQKLNATDSPSGGAIWGTTT